MVKAPLLLVLLFAMLLPSASMAPGSPIPEGGTGNAVGELYVEIGLAGHVTERVFAMAYASTSQHRAKTKVLAIADLSQPSTAKRLYLIDMEKRTLLMKTYVAHGQGSGELRCTSFSNKEGSHQSSKGLYRVGKEIVSPKHGAALLLHGLDKGVNCQALKREVIMHGADYVSEAFIAQHGRLGRSWGCPSVNKADMPRMLELLADGGYLYVYGQ